MDLAIAKKWHVYNLHIMGTKYKFEIEQPNDTLRLIWLTCFCLKMQCYW